MGKSSLTKLKDNLKNAGVIGPKARQMDKNIQKSKKGNRSNMKDIRSRLKDVQSANVNPFELKFTRQKHQVLGRVMKGVKGKPGLTRKRGEEMRHKTLGVELQRKNKEGSFIDRRFGENNPNMTTEDKIMQRFVMEKQKTQSKSAAYSLNDQNTNQEELTHFGQALSSISHSNNDSFETFSDGEPDQMDPEMVARLNFGGFQEETSADGTPKTRKQIMEEVIAKSKFYRYEKQKINEENERIRMELDEEFESVRKLLQESDRAHMEDKAAESKSKRTADFDEKDDLMRKLLGTEYNDHAAAKADDDDSRATKPKAGKDDYDTLVRELVFEKRAKPSDRRKTEEELLAAEAEKLKDMEQLRNKRMHGIPSEADQDSRRNIGDDLGGEYYMDDSAAIAAAGVSDDEDLTLRYKDGVLANDRVFVKKLGNGPRIAEEDSGDEEESEEDASESREESDSEEIGEEEEQVYFLEGIGAEDLDETLGEASNDASDGSENSVEVIEEGVSEAMKQDGGEILQSQIAFTFPCPQDHEALLDILNGASVTGQFADLSIVDLTTILHRIRLLHHEKLGGTNKEKLKGMFSALVEHVLHVCENADMQPLEHKAISPVIDLTLRHLASLAPLFPTHVMDVMAMHAQAILGSSPRLPSLVDIMTFRIVGWLFPTSDSKHDFMDGVMRVLARSLSLGRLSLHAQEGVIVKEITGGLLACQMFLEWVQLPKRFVPEVYIFLHMLLVLFSPAIDVSSINIQNLGLFPIGDAELEFGELRLTEALENKELDYLRILTAPAESISITSQIKSSLMTPTIALLAKSVELYSSYSSFNELYGPTRNLLSKLPQSEEIEALTARIDLIIASGNVKRQYLQLQKFKPVPIPTFVPKFEEEYNIDHHYGAAKQQSTSKLQAQYKKEHKGALRELRKDTAFIQRQKLDEIKQKDREYSTKMQRIAGSMAQQEGEMKEFDRAKKKARKFK